jgi:hypothetical protein
MGCVLAQLYDETGAASIMVRMTARNQSIYDV